MKALFVGCYRDGTTRGRMAQQALLGLDSAGVDVVARPLCYHQSNLLPLEPKILELENKKHKSYDCIIQSVPIETFEPTYEYGIPVYLVTSEDIDNKADMKAASFANKVIRFTPTHSFYDGNLYRKTPPLAPLSFLNNSVVFYTIGKPHEKNRQNWENLLFNFYSAFDKQDNVSLIIKVTAPTDDIEHYFSEVTTRVKNKLKHKFKSLTSFREPIVITDILSDENIVGLHKLGDNYIDFDESPSFHDAYACDCYVHLDPSSETLKQAYTWGKKVQLYQDICIDDKFTNLGKKILEAINV